MRRMLRFLKPMLCALLILALIPSFHIDAHAQTGFEGGVQESCLQTGQQSSLSTENILMYYNEYANTCDNPTVEGFTQYAAEKGIIGRTLAEQEPTTIDAYRARFQLIADGGKVLGYTTASYFLEHSLQNSPDDLDYGSTSTYATQILNSTEMGDIRMAFSAAVSGKNLTYHQISGPTTLNSTTDLHLAYNQVSYVAYGTRTISGLWNLTITITDRYDFQQQPWANQMTTADLVTFINNEAAAAQAAGAIVPYNIRVTVSTQCREVIIENMSVDQGNLVD